MVLGTGFGIGIGIGTGLEAIETCTGTRFDTASLGTPFVRSAATRVKALTVPDTPAAGV